MPLRFTEPRWSRLDTLFQRAVELPAERRAAFAEAECGDDTELRDELLSLLHYDTGGNQSPPEPDFADALGAGAASVMANGSLEGQSLGPYRIGREVGRGGMSVVYLAARDDGQFRRNVAVKLIKRGMDTAAVVGRLRRERSILAALDHPYVARLLDGGSTPDGLPYIVMEYVEGLPIDRYAAAHHLGVEDRCRLADKVCDAVAYAHRNLVIHRDLKPSNILVTPEGSPKLLDFGIAKLLGGGGGADDTPATRSGVFRPFTPEYASPEQVEGHPVGTTTDVYSMGVVLYELLAGARPVSDREKASVAALRYGRGGRWARRLEGDLDTMLQMALRREPERRYLSIAQLQSDLRLHLAGMPISAREETFLYRSGKFLKRNLFGSVATLLLAASLMGGMVATLWQARRAEGHRQLAESRRVEADRARDAAEREREMARQEARLSALAQQRAETEHAEAERQRMAVEAQRELAERRFGQVRELAGKFLIDFHEAIVSLPGSTAARKMVVETGLKYYDSLAREAGSNRSLLEEIARGYDRLGDAQGNPYYANLGDPAGARVSYEKALGIRESIRDPSPEFLADRIDGYARLAQISINDYKKAQQYASRGLALADAQPQASSHAVLGALGMAWSVLGDARLMSGANGQAIEPFRRLLALRLELARESKDQAAAQLGISVAHAKLGDVYHRSERPAEALEHLAAAREIDERLVAAHPGNLRYTRMLKVNYLLLAQVLSTDTGRPYAKPGETTGYFEGAARLAEQMTAADPENRQALRDVADTYTSLGDWLKEEHDPQGAAAAWRKGMAAAQGLVQLGAVATNEGVLSQLYRRLAMAAIAAGEFQQAAANLQKAEEFASAAERANPDATMKIMRANEIGETRTDLLMAQKDWPGAIRQLKAIVAADEEMARQDTESEMPSNDLPQKYAQLADCYHQSGEKGAAAQAMDAALAKYRAIAARRPLTAAEERIRKDGADKLAAWSAAPVR